MTIKPIFIILKFISKSLKEKSRYTSILYQRVGFYGSIK